MLVVLRTRPSKSWPKLLLPMVLPLLSRAAPWTLLGTKCPRTALTRSSRKLGSLKVKAGIKSVLLSSMTVSRPTRYALRLLNLNPSFYLFRAPGQLITYPALGLCAPGEAHKLVERGDNTVRSLNSFILRDSNRYMWVVWWQIRGESQWWPRSQGSPTWCHRPRNAFLHHEYVHARCLSFHLNLPHSIVQLRECKSNCV